MVVASAGLCALLIARIAWRGETVAFHWKWIARDVPRGACAIVSSGA